MFENIETKNIAAKEIKDSIEKPLVDMHLENVVIVKDQGEDHGDVPSRH